MNERKIWKNLKKEKNIKNEEKKIRIMTSSTTFWKKIAYNYKFFTL